MQYQIIIDIVSFFFWIYILLRMASSGI